MNECSVEIKGNEVNMNTQFICGRAAAGFIRVLHQGVLAGV